MTVRPILFSGPMVRALLAGRKTQTRRIVEQPMDHHWHIFPSYKVVPVIVDAENGCFLNWTHSFAEPKAGDYETQRCGKLKAAPGDLLWVRETFSYWDAAHKRPQYQADLNGDHKRGSWKPSIFMPRDASRLTLRVTGVRVERLRDISEDDAKAEGAPCCVMDDDGKFYERSDGSGTYRCGFAGLWDSLNGDKPGRSWDDNPWVAALSFDVIHQHVDAVLAQSTEVPT